jgi:hypothetical protein
MRVRGRPHFNAKGKECHCPWGEGQPGKEHVGHIHESSKLEWLQNREDLQDPKSQAFVRLLQGHNDAGNPDFQSSHLNFTEADKLLPWLVREWKKGRILPSSTYPHQLKYRPTGEPIVPTPNEEHDPNLMPWGPGASRTYTTPDVQHAQLQNLTTVTPDDAKSAVDAMAEMKKHRKGIDAMQHKAHEFFPKVKDFIQWKKDQERKDYGEILHQFDDGWTVRRLQNRDEAEAEGDEMGHCVGSHHGNSVDNGSDLIVSLRDAKNAPHATMQLTPDYYEHRDNPDDTMDPFGWRQVQWKGEPADAEKASKYIPRVGPNSSVEQFYGKEDMAPLDEYQDRMNQYLDQYGIYAEGSEQQEPWWDEEYHAEGVDDPRSYINYYPEEHAPEEYERAWADANDWGMYGPSIYVDPYYGHDFTSILEGLTDQRGTWYNRGQPHNLSGGFSPEIADRVVTKANDTNEDDNLREALDEHLNDHESQVDWDKLSEMKPEEARQAYLQEFGNDPHYQMIQHMGPQLYGDYWEDTNPLNKDVFKPAIHPDQQMLFYPTYPAGGWQGEDPILHQNYSKTASELPTLYYRWTFSPETGVTLSSNDDDHPSLVPYHQDLARGPGDQQHGYAYRIHGGWRLTDWEHGDVKDPYIISQLIRALRAKDRPGDEDGEPARETFARTHYGLPIEDY